jgi:hypothetical protein
VSGRLLLAWKSVIDSSREGVNLKKDKIIMGDRSPKSVHKKAAQKQVKLNAADQKKKDAAAAKQIPGKK